MPIIHPIVIHISHSPPKCILIKSNPDTCPPNFVLYFQWNGAEVKCVSFGLGFKMLFFKIPFLSHRLI